MWYNSRFYRMNLLWENQGLRIRDIHLFNENVPDKYTTEVATSNECTFYTLPIVDGYIWSTNDDIAGLRLKAIIDGKEVLLKGHDPIFTDNGKSNVHISWSLTSISGSLEMDLDEKTFVVKLVSKEPLNWFMDLTTASVAKLPFTSIVPSGINCTFEGTNYRLVANRGTFSKPTNGAAFRLQPSNGSISLNLAVSVK
ncbi:hypothetical protein [Pedobacter sp.]|uniref:hypothetical protein n=1 Tax=Pedobacter sp. TaxID=1411316 RepID=UPI003D7F4AA5